MVDRTSESYGGVAVYREIDGTGNNLLYDEWGSTDEQLLRLLQAAYEDGFPAPSGADRPSFHFVSQTVEDQTVSVSNQAGAGNLLSYAGVADYREIDGTGNNLVHDEWGSTGEQLLRLLPSAYEDGFSAPSGADRPNPRFISQTVADQAESVPNEAGASNFLWAWGQFVDHDIDLTPSTSGEFFPIAVPEGDPYFDPFGTGIEIIPLIRSVYDPATGDDEPRQQINEITAFMDASNVYGSDPVRAAFLRAEDGKLKMSAGELLPYNDGSQPNDGPGGDTAFVAGDVRANENVALTSMHTLFVREHNRLVDELSEKHPGWDGETLYQEARALVEAKIQAVTYNEFLPLLLGEDALPGYQGYDPTVNPGIANEFATAAYRVGHTMLSAEILRMQESGEAVQEGHLALRDAFFNPDLIADEGGIEPILRGLGAGQAEEIDALVIDDVRNFLFGPPGAGGFDLVALNIQRGRDHGLPSYNEARAAFGLDPAEDFSDITDQVWLQERLAEAYDNVDQIDVFIGGLAEDHAEGAMVGELIQAILIDQFTRLRDGDRFWYENRFDGETLEDLQDTTLAELILDNTDVEHIQHEAFLVSSRLGGSDGRDTLIGDGGRNLIYGADGNDRVIGRDGDDDLFGDGGNDRVYGQNGDDWLWGGDGRDRMWGGAGDDALFGGDEVDVLWGGVGADWFDGGPGDDLVFSGPGDDTVYFDAGYGAGARAGEEDRLADLQAGDVLDFSDLIDAPLESAPEDSAAEVDNSGEWHYDANGGSLSVYAEAAAAAVTIDIGSQQDMAAEQMKLIIA